MHFSATPWHTCFDECDYITCSWVHRCNSIWKSNTQTHPYKQYTVGCLLFAHISQHHVWPTWEWNSCCDVQLKITQHTRTHTVLFSHAQSPKKTHACSNLNINLNWSWKLKFFMLTDTLFYSTVLTTVISKNTPSDTHKQAHTPFSRVGNIMPLSLLCQPCLSLPPLYIFSLLSSNSASLHPWPCYLPEHLKETGGIGGRCSGEKSAISSPL